MKTHLLAVTAFCLAAVGWAYEPPAHTNTFVRKGVTYAQRGGMNATTYVVTNIDMTASDVGAVGRDETWESVSNKAMTALQTLEPATNYTDEAIAALKAEDVGAVSRDANYATVSNRAMNAVQLGSPALEQIIKESIPSHWALANVTNASGNAVKAADVGALALYGGAMNDGATVSISRQVSAEEQAIDVDGQANIVSPTYIKTEISASGLSVKSVNNRGWSSPLASIDANTIMLNGEDGGVSIGSSSGFLGGSETAYRNGKIVQNLSGGMTEITNTLPEESGTFATREWVGENATPADYANVSNRAMNAVQKDEVELVNPIAEFYDATRQMTWRLDAVDFELKLYAVTNVDATAFTQVNNVLTDTVTTNKTRLVVTDGEMKFFHQ